MRGLALCLSLIFAAEGHAAERTLSFGRPAEDLQAVTLEAGVGDVTVTGCDCDEITAVVVVSGKRWQLEELGIVPKIEGKTLRLSLARRQISGKKAGEDWSVQLPRRFAVSVEAGVGDVHITGVQGDVEVELGVGDVRVAGFAGNLAAETGVGDVEVSGPWEKVGNMRLVTGVGSITVKTPDGRLEGHGMVSESLSEEGPGTANIRVNTGVGDITLRFREE